MEQAVAFWSGGKDSALALDRLRRGGEFEIAALITTISKEYKRVSMHGVREELVEAQARALELPLDKMYVGPDSSNATYVAALRQTLGAWRARRHARVIRRHLPRRFAAMARDAFGRTRHDRRVPTVAGGYAQSGARIRRARLQGRDLLRQRRLAGREGCGPRARWRVLRWPRPRHRSLWRERRISQLRP